MMIDGTKPFKVMTTPDGVKPDLTPIVSLPREDYVNFGTYNTPKTSSQRYNWQ